MVKVHLISMLLTLADASIHEMIAEGQLALGIWYCDNRFTLYSPHSYHSCPDSVLCPQSFSHGVMYGGSRSTSQALCVNDHDFRQRHSHSSEQIVGYPNFYQFIDIHEENKLEWDLYHFLLGWADVWGSYNYDTFVIGLQADTTPCFVTMIEVDNGDQYTTYYFEVDQANFIFKRLNFTFKNIMYNKMYCNERNKLEEEEKFFNPMKYQIIYITIALVVACGEIILIILLCQYCYVSKKQAEFPAETLDNEIVTVIHA